VTDEGNRDDPLLGGEVGTPPEERKQRDPVSTLTSAMLVYIFVNLAFALPLAIFPAAYFDIIGLDSTVADQLGGLRWVGGMLLAWSIAAIQVMARPGGKSVFVTTGAFQMTFGAVAFLYSWSIREYKWDVWYQAIASIILTLGAVYMWWARMSARKLLKGTGTQ
jgi:ABC-type Fe3+-siderophore transport system permease subunit